MTSQVCASRPSSSRRSLGNGKAGWARRLPDRGLAAEGLARERFADHRDARGAGCVVIGEEAAGQQPEPDDVGTDGSYPGQQLFPRGRWARAGRPR